MESHSYSNKAQTSYCVVPQLYHTPPRLLHNLPDLPLFPFQDKIFFLTQKYPVFLFLELSALNISCNRLLLIFHVWVQNSIPYRGLPWPPFLTLNDLPHSLSCYCFIIVHITFITIWNHDFCFVYLFIVYWSHKDSYFIWIFHVKESI